LGDINNSEKYFKLAHSIIESRYSSYDPELIYSLKRLGNLYRQIKNYSLCEHYYKKILELEEEEFGLDSIELINSILQLGIINSFQGNYNESEDKYLRALCILKNSSELDREMAKVLFHLGDLYFGQNKYILAGVILERTKFTYKNSNLSKDTFYYQTLDKLKFIHNKTLKFTLWTEDEIYDFDTSKIKLTMEDALKILEIDSKNPNIEYIKKQFRNLAKKYHPDLNPAEDGDKFHKVNLAYQKAIQLNSTKFEYSYRNYEENNNGE